MKRYREHVLAFNIFLFKTKNRFDYYSIVTDTLEENSHFASGSSQHRYHIWHVLFVLHVNFLFTELLQSYIRFGRCSSMFVR